MADTTTTTTTQQPGWQARAGEKQKRVQALIPDAWKIPAETTQQLLKYPLEKSKNNLIELDLPRRSGILSTKELRITEGYDVGRLLKALSSGELTALEVTVAFCKRAAIAQQLVRFFFSFFSFFLFFLSRENCKMDRGGFLRNG